MNKDKKQLVIKSLLDRLAIIELASQDEEFQDWIEDLIEHICQFETLNSPTCNICGCTEFLCGHNKRK